MVKHMGCISITAVSVFCLIYSTIVYGWTCQELSLKNPNAQIQCDGKIWANGNIVSSDDDQSKLKETGSSTITLTNGSLDLNDFLEYVTFVTEKQPHVSGTGGSVVVNMNGKKIRFNRSHNTVLGYLLAPVSITDEATLGGTVGNGIVAESFIENIVEQARTKMTELGVEFPEVRRAKHEEEQAAIRKQNNPSRRFNPRTGRFYPPGTQYDPENGEELRDMD